MCVCVSCSQVTHVASAAALSPAQMPSVRRTPRQHPEDSDDDILAPGRLFSTNKRVLLIATINFIHRSIEHGSVDPESIPHGSVFKAYQEAQYHQNIRTNYSKTNNQTNE